MAYTLITMEELGWIDVYLTIGLSASKTVERLGHSKQKVYDVIHFLEEGKTIQDYYRRYKENKKKGGVKKRYQKIKLLKSREKQMTTGLLMSLLVEPGKRLGAPCETFIGGFKIVMCLR